MGYKVYNYLDKKFNIDKVIEENKDFFYGEEVKEEDNFLQTKLN